jgi:hypothetical protein
MRNLIKQTEVRRKQRADNIVDYRQLVHPPSSQRLLGRTEELEEYKSAAQRALKLEKRNSEESGVFKEQLGTSSCLHVCLFEPF